MCRPFSDRSILISHLLPTTTNITYYHYHNFNINSSAHHHDSHSFLLIALISIPPPALHACRHLLLSPQCLLSQYPHQSGRQSSAPPPPPSIHHIIRESDEFKEEDLLILSLLCLTEGRARRVWTVDSTVRRLAYMRSGTTSSLHSLRSFLLPTQHQ